MTFNVKTTNFPVGYQTDYTLTAMPNSLNGMSGFIDGIVYPLTIKPVDTNGLETISFKVSAGIPTNETITLNVGDVVASVAIIGSQMHA